MGNTLIDQLDASGNLAEYWDLRRGSLLGRKGNNLTVVGAPTWSKPKGRVGIYSPNAGSNWLSAGNPAALQLVGQAADEAGERGVPPGDFLDQGLHVAIFPVAALVSRAVEDAKFLRLVQQRDEAEMASKELFHAAQRRVAGVLRLTETPPAQPSRPVGTL